MVCLCSVVINVRSWNVSAPGSWVVPAVFAGLATRRRCWVRPGPVGKDDFPSRRDREVGRDQPGQTRLDPRGDAAAAPAADCALGRAARLAPAGVLQPPPPYLLELQ